MTIRPIDKSTIIPATERVASKNQDNISKGDNLNHSGAREFKKIIDKKQKTVTDIEKTQYGEIDSDDSNRGSKEEPDKEKDNEPENPDDTDLGSKLDLRI